MGVRPTYEQRVARYDQLLTRGGFVRICDYTRRVCADDLIAFSAAVESANDERPIHSLLEDRPHLVVNAEFAHGCRWFRANPRLGRNYVPDFMVVRMDSGGLRWTLVELQSPRLNGRLFIDTAKPGQAKPGEQLREALDQISRWRAWIRRRGSVAAEADGYPHLTPDFRGVIFIGRSEDKLRDLDEDDRIADLEQEHRVEIKSYDSIHRAAEDVRVIGCGIDHD